MAATIGSALRWWADTKGDQRALIVEDEALTYRELRDWSSRVARRLAAGGIAPGDRVGVLGPNSLIWPVLALGALKAGAVLVPLNPRLKPAELRKVLDDSDAVLAIAPIEFAEQIEQTRRLGRDFRARFFEEFAVLRFGERDDFRIDTGRDDPVALLFTSGSTGLSKGVVCTKSVARLSRPPS